MNRRVATTALAVVTLFVSVEGIDGQKVELVGSALAMWLEMTCTPEHATTVANEKAKADLFDRLLEESRWTPEIETADDIEAEVARRLGPHLFDVWGGAVNLPPDSLRKLGFNVDGRVYAWPEPGLDARFVREGDPVGPDGIPYSAVSMSVWREHLGESLTDANVLGLAIIRACYFQREPRVFISDWTGEPLWWVDNYLTVRRW